MHIGSRVERVEKSSEWLQIDAQFGDLAREWSGRNDIVVYVGVDGGQNIAPALFDPAKAEIEVNATKAFGETAVPALIGDLRDRRELSEWSKAGGLLLHESMHAKYSTADWRDLYEEAQNKWGKVRGYNVMEVYKLIEETRIESRGVRDWPRDKAYLRASAMWLVEESLAPKKDENGNEMPPQLDLTTVALLLCGRVDAGVLKKGDIRKLWDLVVDQWGKALFEQIRTLWKEFQLLNDNNQTQLRRMLEISETVLRLLPQPPASAKPENGDGEGDEGQGQGQGSGLSQADMDALADALDEAKSRSQHGGAREAQDEAEAQASEQRAAQREEEGKRRKDNQKAADNTFNSNGIGNQAYGRSNSSLRSSRDPRSEEVLAAGTLARALSRAKYRDREQRRIRQELPPGRLHGGAAMRVDAAISQGRRSDGFDPFRRTVRTHVDDPRLSVGIMCDISGSMGGTMEPMGVATWIVAEATRRLADARAASVYFGAGTFPTLKPGQRLPKVNVYSAPDGAHMFDEAFRALDGGLDLLDGSGARLLVVCSDGLYETHQVAAVKKWLKECQKNGVGVVWLGLKQGAAQGYCQEAGAGCEYVEIADGNVTQAAGVIGRAMEKALTNAGSRR